MEISGGCIYGTMRLFYLFSLLFTVISISSCSAKKEVLVNQQILLFKDTNGLYIHDFKTNAERLIYKLDSTDFFEYAPCTFSNDKVAFRIFKERRFTKEEYYKIKTKRHPFRMYVYQTIMLDTKTLHHQLTEKKVYGFFGEGNFLLRKTSYDSIGKVIAEKDSMFVTSNFSRSRRGIYFDDTFPNFTGISTVAEKTVYSFEGSLYLVYKNDTSLLAKSPESAHNTANLVLDFLAL